MRKTYLVADVGGTQIRAALFPADQPQPIKVVRISTQGEGQAPLERLLAALASLWPAGDQVAAVTVAAPGPLDPYEGIVFEAPNVPGWENLPLKKHLRERFNVPAAIGNDANLAALGEWRYGAGRGHNNLIYITVSTGIGGGVISDGQLLIGAHGLAGELGHTTIIADGPLCGCGQRGHLEALASGPSIARWVEEQLAAGHPSILADRLPITAREVATAAAQNDALAVAALRRAGTYLGIGIANFLHIFNPTAIIIGGGVSRSGPYLFDAIHASLEERVLSRQYLDDLVLTTAALGDDAGLMGALALAQTVAGS